MVNAHEIFLGFTKYYNSLNIVWDESLSTHTNRLLSYFDELGRMLGYNIITENTLGNLISPCPEVMKNKKVDMIWRHDRGNEIIYELAIESQQSPETDLIRNDIKKLVILPANLKVLYCSAKALDDIVTAIRNEIKQDKDTSGSFLAIVDPWVGSRAFSKGILNGVLLDAGGLLIGEGSAKVQEINDGAHSVRMFLEAN